MKKYLLGSFFLLFVFSANSLFADVFNLLVLVRDAADEEKREEAKSFFFRPEPIELSNTIMIGIGFPLGYSHNEEEEFQCLAICESNSGESKDFKAHIQGLFFEYYLLDSLGIGYRRIEVLTDSDIHWTNNYQTLSGHMIALTPTIQWVFYTSDSLETRLGVIGGLGKASYRFYDSEEYDETVENIDVKIYSIFLDHGGSRFGIRITPMVIESDSATITSEGQQIAFNGSGKGLMLELRWAF